MHENINIKSIRCFLHFTDVHMVGKLYSSPPLPFIGSLFGAPCQGYQLCIIINKCLLWGR